jgi:hypothetical protein
VGGMEEEEHVGIQMEPRMEHKMETKDSFDLELMYEDELSVPDLGPMPSFQVRNWI